MKAIGSLFGGGGDGEAARLAQQQEKALAERRDEEKRKKESQLALIRGLQGRGGRATLFSETGTQGVREVLG